MPRSLVACAAVAAVLLLSGTRLPADPVPGTIAGAEAVNVRRGPGTESPAFVALRRGTRLQVEEQSGQWARVVLESGERGYVNSAFIELSPGATVPAAAAAAAELAPTEPSLPVPTATVAPTVASDLDREMAELRERLASLEQTLEQPSASPTLAAPVASDGDVGEPRLLPPLAEPPATLDVGPSLALAGVGFVVGFLFGTFYGQRQERNRRLRVRF